MIMGAGKTAVVAPLLALLLGNRETLVMQVVPAALLQFSRSVMRQRFSSLLQPRTFHFDRFTAASPELLSKLLQAQQLSAVMLSTPTSVKSFVLKFVEVVHLLERNLNADEEDMLSASNAAGELMRIVGLERRSCGAPSRRWCRAGRRWSPSSPRRRASPSRSSRR